MKNSITVHELFKGNKDLYKAVDKIPNVIK